MLKYVSLIALVVTCLNAAAQDKDVLKKDEVGNHYYEEVVQIPGMKKEASFAFIKAWITANLKTTDNNINFDQENFSAVNTGAMKVGRKLLGMGSAIQGGNFDFKFHVWCKDDRVKFRIDNVMFNLLMNLGTRGYAEEHTAYNELEDNKKGRFLRDEVNNGLQPFINKFKTDLANAKSKPATDDKW